MKLLIPAAIALSVTGCSIFDFSREEVEPIKVISKPVERTPLVLPDLLPLDTLDVKWIVITPDNAESVFAKLQKEGTDLVLFGLTDGGYERLSINMAKIRNYIDNQRVIIIKYREYYEPKKEENN